MIRVTVLLAMTAAALAQVTPPGKPAAAPAPRRPAAPAALPNYSELKYPPLRSIESPAVQNVTLANGMRLLLLENHELPLINGTVLVRTGSAFDPPEKIGLAALTAQVMLEGGTTATSGEGLTRRFQDLGAEVDRVVTENLLSISFLGLRTNTDEVLEVLKDGLTAPDFPQARIDLAKAHLRYTIAHRNDDAATVLGREFAATIYGKNSPYGAQLEYTTLDRINRGDLVAFHHRYFFPKNVMLAIEGDFDPARMKGRIEALFDDWKFEQPAVPDFPVVENDVVPGKFLAVRKDLKRSYFSIGQAGGDYLDKDYPALEILSAILGGGPNARLNQLYPRDVDGLTVTWSPGFGHPGLFRVTGTIANPFLTTKILSSIYEELSKIRTGEVSEQELKTAKASVLNRTVFGFDNQFSILPRLAEYQYFHLPADYTEQHQKALEGVTRADVLRAARERLDPSKMTTLVVANPTLFESPLDTLGGSPVNVIDLAIPPPKVEATVGDATSQGVAKALLERAQQALGGADRLAAVTDYVQEISYQFDVSAGGAHATLVERWMAPGRIRQDNTTATSKVSLYCDGKIGWIASGRNSGALTGVQLKQVQSDLFRSYFPLMVSDRIPGRKINSLDDQTVEISDGAGEMVKLVFDPATGLPKNAMYDATTVNGTVAVLETYADYRDVSGLKVPYQIAIMLAGKKFQDQTITGMKINSGLKLQDLEQRP